MQHQLTLQHVTQGCPCGGRSASWESLVQILRWTWQFNQTTDMLHAMHTTAGLKSYVCMLHVPCMLCR